jgi:glycosyltransferase involved in cell wall biosynthesis
MSDPVFGFLAFTSGSFEGAIIRDMRLANALHRRGYAVRVYWMMERNPELVDAGIPQSHLATGLRYYAERPGRVMDLAGRVAAKLWDAKRRRRFTQERPELVARLLSNFCRAICDGDPRLSRAIATACKRDGVTHLLPTFAMTCPFVRDLKRDAGADYLVTFQGEEIFANYAARIGRLDDYCARLREAVNASAFPAVAVSRDYVDRVAKEIGVDRTKLRPIYPGIDLPELGAAPSFDVLQQLHPELRRNVPLIAYLGRQDPEKGIDLLLYALRMVRDRTGQDVQLFVAGGTSFGQHYQDSCKAIAEHLRLPVFWKRRISDEARSALFAHARMIVYPPIHREPFGMVAAEVMSHGTPVIVPDLGGITEVITTPDGRAGGLTFRSWDSHDLSLQIERLLTDESLRASLKSNARAVAEQFSVDRMTDEVLAHLGLNK